MNILEALKNDMKERYDHIIVWDGEPYSTFQEFRMVFEVAPKRKGQSIKAIRYVDVRVIEDCVEMCSQHRKSIKVMLEVPNSFDELDAFIEEHCLKERTKLRNIGSLEMAIGEIGTKNLRPRSSIG